MLWHIIFVFVFPLFVILSVQLWVQPWAHCVQPLQRDDQPWLQFCCIHCSSGSAAVAGAATCNTRLGHSMHTQQYFIIRKQGGLLTYSLTGLRKLNPLSPPPLTLSDFFQRTCFRGEGKWVFSSLIHSVAIVLCYWKPHVRVGFSRAREEKH